MNLVHYENKYRSLNKSQIYFGSVLVFRLLAGFVGLIGVLLTISVITTENVEMESIILPVAIAAFIYLITLFSSILYNSTEIVVQNIYGKKVFKKEDFFSITPWQSYINIYIIKFKDGQSCLFGTGALFIKHDAVKSAGELTKELLADRVAQVSPEPGS